MNQRANEANHRDPDPIRSLCMMKQESVFHKCITDIGINPFYCIFFTPEQVEWLRLSTRMKRCIISIDSTGKNILYNFLIKTKINYCMFFSNKKI